MEKVSVIVPVYNVDKYLSECLDSILNQSYKNIEIILVDDGSSDNSGAICEKYKSKDERITVIHKSNGGLSDARNAGMDIMTGKYVTFIDSDDWITGNYVEEMVAVIEKTFADIVIGSMIEKKVDSNQSKELYKNKYVDYDVIPAERALELLASEKKIGTCAPNKLFNAKLLAGIRFPKGKIYEDKFVMHWIFGKCSAISFAKKAIYYYRGREGSIINSSFTLSKIDYMEASFDRLVYYVKYYPRFSKYVKANYVENMMRIIIDAIKSEADKELIRELRKSCRSYFFYFIRYYGGSIYDYLRLCAVYCVYICGFKS